MSYEGKFKTILEETILVSDTKEVRIKVDEDKQTGEMKMHVREFIKTNRYTGYTNNGATIPVNTKKDLEYIRSTFTKFFNLAERILD